MIKECVGCKKQFHTSDSRAKFCKKDCYTDHQKGPGRGRAQSPETRRKIAQSLAEYRAANPSEREATRKTRPKKSRLPSEERLKNLHAAAAVRSKNHAEKIANMCWDDLSPKLRFDRVKKQQNHTCARCKNSHWLGQPITLEIEHIDGDRINNARDNLEALCPNCHSYTSTWRGRNAARKATDEEMLAALKEHSSITKALTSLGMAAKGNNFKRAKRLLGIDDDVKLVRKRNNIVDFK